MCYLEEEFEETCEFKEEVNWYEFIANHAKVDWDMQRCDQNDEDLSDMRHPIGFDRITRDPKVERKYNQKKKPCGNARIVKQS